jgi:hypothetical protein
VIKSTLRRDEVRNSRTDQEQTRPRYRPRGHTAAGSQLWTCGGRESMEMEMGTGNV